MYGLHMLKKNPIHVNFLQYLNEHQGQHVLEQFSNRY